MRTRLVIPAILLCLLGLLQLQLWTGRGSLPDVAKLRKNLEDQKTANLRAQHTNERLESEVNDLMEGIEMAEERARQELGMVKPNEILVQIAR